MSVKGIKKLYFFGRKKVYQSLESWPGEVADDLKPGFVNVIIQKKEIREIGGSRIFFENLKWVLKFTLKFWVGLEKFSEFSKSIPAQVDYNLCPLPYALALGLQ